MVPLIFKIVFPIVSLNIDILPGLVRAYLALAKCKDALFTAREAMKVMHQSAKALKLVGDVHAISSSGREKVILFCEGSLIHKIFLGSGNKQHRELDLYLTRRTMMPLILGTSIALGKNLHFVTDGHSTD